ncbi:hypothetical protein B0T10DRAFT_530032 [Thelonectria olida]|uniref:Zn(2)-C6 fungal-type domain-containing protein n=1 Tax=Thelonectria olida TaxID=1576542 RepID=A0A9P8W2Q7_9HYPO|nr:hypothetical protein B0T10DRAFT_530032 [Thelonectria olida]
MSHSSKRASNTPSKGPSGRTSVQKAAPVIACQTCRSKKVRCSGPAPCQYCSKRGLSCSITPHGPRRVYSVTRIEELESRLARYERHNQISDHDDVHENSDRQPTPSVQDDQSEPEALGPILFDSPHTCDDDQPPTPRDAPAETRAESHTPPRRMPSPRPFSNPRTSDTYNQHGIPSEPSLSSSHAFSSKVQDMLMRSRLNRQADSQSSSSRLVNIDTNTSLFGLPSRAEKSLPQLPPEREAHRLFEIVNLYIGQTQNHYDPRELSDRMGLLYGSGSDSIQTHDLWCMEIIIILAIGKMLTADFDDDGVFPGIKLFEFAYQNFPPLSVHYSQGRLGVETHALMAMYLQMANRKEEAYLYIATALRLAVLCGYHQEEAVAKCLRSERVHLNRLFWTVYMQERRLAAATGQQSGINDDAIDLPLPEDAPGFLPSGPLRANIKIAKVTGQVIKVLYGPTHRTEEDFVGNVQQILKGLFDISREIPSEKSLSTGTNSDIALRTIASLHLMVYQSFMMGPLESCHEHAPRQLEDCSKPLSASRTGVCSSYPVDVTLAIFGFFDCDAIFSAAFIMLLTAIFDSTCEPGHKINPTPGLPEAMGLLQYLTDRGNMFAPQRLQEVKTMRDHLGTIFQVPQVLNEGHRQQDVANTGEAVADGMIDPNLHPTCARRPEHPDAMPLLSENQPSPWDTDLWNGISEIQAVPLGIADPSRPSGNFVTGFPIEEYYGHYQSLLNDPEWTLTGQDVRDFAELQRHVLGSNL